MGSYNPYVDFYGKHNISPVHANMGNWKRHYQNRRNLFRQLGIPWQCIQNKQILEFGPGGGYNALLLLQGGGAAY